MALADSDSICYLSYRNLTFSVVNCHIPDSRSYITGQAGRVFVKGKQDALSLFIFVMGPKNFFLGPKNCRLQLAIFKGL